MSITYDSTERSQHLADAVYVLTAESGLTSLTLRRIASQAGVSAGSILNHFGSKQRAIGVCSRLISKELLTDLQERVRERGALGFAPVRDDEVVHARVWLGVCELGRTDDWVADVVRDHRRTELDMLSRALAHTAAPLDLTALKSCFDGLNHAVAALEDPLPSTLARASATRLLDLLAPNWRDINPDVTAYGETWAALSRRA